MFILFWFLSKAYNVLSLAKFLRFEFLKTSIIKMLKISGPRIHHLATLPNIAFQELEMLFTLVLWNMLAI